MRAAPTPFVVFSTDVVIRDVNPAYARATMRTREELIGRLMFDGFPDNPASGCSRWTSSTSSA